MTQDRDVGDLRGELFAIDACTRSSVSSQSQLSIRARAARVVRVRLRIRRSRSQESAVENLTWPNGRTRARVTALISCPDGSKRVAVAKCRSPRNAKRA